MTFDPCTMPIDIEDVLEKAFEQAFVRALDQAIQGKLETLFVRALSPDSAFGKKLEEKIEQGLQRFMQGGIRWDKKRAGFKKG